MNYPKHNFISPDQIYARVKEEMKAYFSTGAIDDLMFSLWTQDCIEKFQKSYLKINECVLNLNEFQAELPCDFDSAREVWACANVINHMQTPSAYYYQEDYRITPAHERCWNPCTEEVCNRDECINGDPIDDTPTDQCNCPIPIDYLITRKVTGTVVMSYSIAALLKPGSHRTLRACAKDCVNVGSTCLDTFDIHGNKLVTSFSDGHLYLVYYSKEYSESGSLVIPDRVYFRQYLKDYIKYQLYMTLLGQTNAETFNQMKYFMELAERQMWQSFASAKAEAISKNMYQEIDDIKKSYNRHNRFIIR